MTKPKQHVSDPSPSEMRMLRAIAVSPMGVDAGTLARNLDTSRQWVHATGVRLMGRLLARQESNGVTVYWHATPDGRARIEALDNRRPKAMIERAAES